MFFSSEVQVTEPVEEPVVEEGPVFMEQVPVVEEAVEQVPETVVQEPEPVVEEVAKQVPPSDASPRFIEALQDVVSFDLFFWQEYKFSFELLQDISDSILHYHTIKLKRCC